MEQLALLAEVVGILTTIDPKALLTLRTLVRSLQTLGSTDPQMTAAGMAPPTQHMPMMAADACPQRAQTPPTQQTEETQQTQQTPVMDHACPQGAPASPEMIEQDMKDLVFFLIHAEDPSLHIKTAIRTVGRESTIAIAAYMDKILDDCKIDEADLNDEVLCERVAAILTDIRAYLDRNELLWKDYSMRKKDLDDVMTAFAETRPSRHVYSSSGTPMRRSGMGRSGNPIVSAETTAVQENLDQKG